MEDKVLIDRNTLIELFNKAFAYDAYQWGGIEKHWPQARLIVNRYRNIFLADNGIADKKIDIGEYEVSKLDG